MLGVFILQGVRKRVLIGNRRLAVFFDKQPNAVLCNTIKF